MDVEVVAAFGTDVEPLQKRFRRGEEFGGQSMVAVDQEVLLKPCSAKNGLSGHDR
jgi:hypothetical protein